MISLRWGCDTNTRLLCLQRAGDILFAQTSIRLGETGTFRNLLSYIVFLIGKAKIATRSKNLLQMGLKYFTMPT